MDSFPSLYSVLHSCSWAFDSSTSFCWKERRGGWNRMLNPPARSRDLISPASTSCSQPETGMWCWKYMSYKLKLLNSSGSWDSLMDHLPFQGKSESLTFRGNNLTYNSGGKSISNPVPSSWGIRSLFLIPVCSIIQLCLQHRTSMNVTFFGSFGYLSAVFDPHFYPSPLADFFFFFFFFF